MSRYIEGQDRQQVTLLPECLDDFIAEDNTVRIVDVFINELDLVGLGFDGAKPATTGRPSYHPSVLLKLYLYGYLNRIQSSRRLERECQRNMELMWLIGRLAPDFKTIADFRRNNGKGIRNVCRRFVMLCRELKLFSDAVVAIDGSKFKAATNFGCGSSREHAVWALVDFGIRAVASPRFGEIFRTNCVRNGVLAAIISDEAYARLAALAREGGQGLELSFDLESGVICGEDLEVPFQIDTGDRERLLKGLDEISETLTHLDAIKAFAHRDAERRPWLDWTPWASPSETSRSSFS